jgi:hypothetical protein
MQLGVLSNARSFGGVEYVIHELSTAIDIWGRIQNEDQELPISVTVFLRIFSPQEKSEPVVLGYSQFHQENSHFDVTAARSLSLKPLLKEILPLYDEVYQNAASYWKTWEDTRKLCDHAVSESWCRAENCSYSHTAPASDQCKKTIRVSIQW